jgi:hypothetical protein
MLTFSSRWPHGRNLRQGLHLRFTFKPRKEDAIDAKDLGSSDELRV